MSRHAAPKSEHLLIGVAFVAVILAVTAAVTSLGPSASEAGPDRASCSPREVRLDAAPELAVVLRSVLEDEGCDRIIVGELAPEKVLHNLSEGLDVPDLWIPDSSSWVSRLGPAGADVVADFASPSLATTPVVVAATGDAPTSSWADVLSDPGYLGGDPMTSSTAAAPLLGAQAEERDSRAYAEAMVPVAQRYAGGGATADVQQRLDAVAEGSGHTVATEQAVLSSGHDDLDVAVPEEGTLFLDYPLVVSANRHREEAGIAASWLIRALAEPAGRKALAEAGFRAPDAGPLPDRGIGKVPALEVDPKKVPDVLRLWARLALPTRALAVFDVSGSMGFEAGDSTRMALTLAAARAGVDLFPDAAAIGLWQFSERLDGDRDHEALLPIRRLDAEVDGTDQRSALVQALGRISFVPGTGTGLYDTVLAAFEEVQASYDPKSVNSVILFTDGRNEDPGSIDLETLLQQLDDLQKPTQPVAVITIGISTDADVAALEQISAATGGTSYVARDPQDIGEVFRQALSARAS